MPTSDPSSSTDPYELAEALITPRDLIRWGASRFNEQGLAFGHGNDNALDEAAQLVLYALHLPHDLPADYLDARLTIAERVSTLELLQRRIDERRPAAYLTHETLFAGLSFYVDERVLVPRSPIAELINCGFQPWLGDLEPERILDLCTGSGAIAVACALAFPDAEVTATDLSEDALEVAKINAERHQVDLRVHTLKSDLYAELVGQRFDLIVTNPPYVSGEEMQGLDAEYRHEPAMAFAGGGDGLDMVADLLMAAPDYLNAGGLLALEVGYSAYLMEQRWPDLPITWAELEHGGVGIGVLEAEDLSAWRDTQTADSLAETDHGR